MKVEKSSADEYSPDGSGTGAKRSTANSRIQMFSNVKTLMLLNLFNCKHNIVCPQILL